MGTRFFFNDEVGLNHQQIKDCAVYALNIDYGSGLKKLFTAMYFWQHRVIRLSDGTANIDFSVDVPPASRQPHINIIEDLCKQALIDLVIYHDQITIKGLFNGRKV